ncbi:hypothetical protein WICPIJ_009429 [Wickerhamomyces pijperi]|uniref:Uncharacterized protein n=1 Tax=Wickerhamomyces pijperi TaxID=599730 RepID=A0A9P8PNT0_WICPI|nr:hypothetical protein WICPIJ_009429 [Wickerhamomyces pijperi]
MTQKDTVGRVDVIYARDFEAAADSSNPPDCEDAEVEGAVDVSESRASSSCDLVISSFDRPDLNEGSSRTNNSSSSSSDGKLSSSSSDITASHRWRREVVRSVEHVLSEVLEVVVDVSVWRVHIERFVARHCAAIVVVVDGNEFRRRDRVVIVVSWLVVCWLGSRNGIVPAMVRQWVVMVAAHKAVVVIDIGHFDLRDSWRNRVHV